LVAAVATTEETAATEERLVPVELVVMVVMVGPEAWICVRAATAPRPTTVSKTACAIRLLVNALRVTTYPRESPATSSASMTASVTARAPASNATTL
jgi:hypothetical protein